MFVDKARVNLIAGSGGDGITSFRHEMYVKLGGPDGGDGGNGGNVVLRASHNQNTLASFRYKKLHKPQNGENGRKAKMHGKNGSDLLVDVPVGTVVLSETGEILADFTADSQEEILASGGKGGFGNAHFASSTRSFFEAAAKSQCSNFSFV